MTQPLLLFAPGAGALSSSSWMQAWRERLLSLGAVVTFDYDYLKRGRKTPDRLPVLIAAHRNALTEARSYFSGQMVLIGKSMGGRIGCHVSLEEPVHALICLGYPLKGANGAIRDDVLLRLRTPILFVQGTRDTLCPLDLLNDVRARMSAPNDLHTVEEANHSLQVQARQLKSDGQTQEHINQGILEAIRRFLDDHLPA